MQVAHKSAAALPNSSSSVTALKEDRPLFLFLNLGEETERIRKRAVGAESALVVVPRAIANRPSSLPNRLLGIFAGITGPDRSPPARSVATSGRATISREAVTIFRGAAVILNQHLSGGFCRRGSPRKLDPTFPIPPVRSARRCKRCLIRAGTESRM